MDRKIPASALVLGLAGVLPFLWGVLTLLSADLSAWGAGYLGPRFVAPFVQISYGAIILAFMSGVLWGFATKGTGRLATIGYALSVVPALWIFFLMGKGPSADLVTLIGGFMALLALDWFFWHNGLAPPWWMVLRALLTFLVLTLLILSLVLLT